MGYAEILAEHRRLLREAFARHDGVEVDTQGDAFFVAFPTAVGAIDPAADAGDALEPGPVRDELGRRGPLDLWDREAVAENADAILEGPRSGTMQCDGAWPEDQFDPLAARIDQGIPA